MRAGSVLRRLAAGSAMVMAGVLALAPTALANGTWAHVASPDKTNSRVETHNQLLGVSSSASNSVWAVGDWYNTTIASDRTLGEFFNGTSWTVKATANKGTAHNQLSGVATVSSKNAWAVGYYYNTTVHWDRTLVEHYASVSGVLRWVVAASPNAGAEHNELTAIAAVPGSNGLNLWAVGDYFDTTTNSDRTLIEHYTSVSGSHKWVVVASPNVGTLHNALMSVAVVPGSNGKKVFAVGDYFNGTEDRTLTEEWDGTSWSVVSSPNIGMLHNELDSVTAVPNATALWAVGTYYNGTNDQTLTERWNGSAWAVVSSPNVVTYTNSSGTIKIAGNQLSGIDAISSKDVVAIGTYDEYDPHVKAYTPQSLAEHWNGTSWSIVKTPELAQKGGATPTDNTIDAVSGTSGAVVAVGWYYDGTADQTLVLKCAC
jgi:hypothetical protein